MSRTEQPGIPAGKNLREQSDGRRDRDGHAEAGGGGAYPHAASRVGTRRQQGHVPGLQLGFQRP
ncbi:MAG TPA: hypothetical protein VGB64_04215 [Actinomycetota bacterium]